MEIHRAESELARSIQNNRDIIIEDRLKRLAMDSADRVEISEEARLAAQDIADKERELRRAEEIEAAHDEEQRIIEHNEVLEEEEKENTDAEESI